MNVLAIDQGTSSTKALVIGEDGEVLSLAESPVAVRSIPGGGIEQDPTQLWNSVVDAGCQAVAEAGVSVSVVGFANQGETVLAWDRTSGRGMSTAISWQDRRAKTVSDRLLNRAGELTAITGLPLDPYFAGPKMTWLRENVTRQGVITTTDSWLIHQMTGAYVTDATTASRTMLVDLKTRTWSPVACEAFGLELSQLPDIVGCAEPIGVTDVFGSPMTVTGLCVDQQAALVGERCLEQGDAKCTFGTGAFLLANSGDEARWSRSGLSASIAWQLGDSAAYCVDGQVYTAGEAIAWLCRWGFLAKHEDLDVVGGSVRDSAGVTVVPAMCGLGAPWWRPEALASIEGISLSVDRAHVVRATIEGLAAQVALLARAAGQDLGVPLTRLQVDGGLTRSRVLMQTQADLLQIPVEVAPSPHATALGVGALARLGAGDGKTLYEVVPALHSVQSYQPAIEADEAAERLARFEEAVDRCLSERGATGRE